MKATILCIGDELLIGQTLNTNARWISQKMNEIGVDVIRTPVAAAIALAMTRSSLCAGIRTETLG